MANSTRLSRKPTAKNIDVHIELPNTVGQFEGLHNKHARGWTNQILLEGPAIDCDLAITFFQMKTSNCGFTLTDGV